MQRGTGLPCCSMSSPTSEAGEKNAPVLVTGAWRFAAKVVVLGLVGILALPVLLFFRVRRLVRFMFARRDDA